jgi:uncharacterized protein (TIGR03437 family)
MRTLQALFLIVPCAIAANQPNFTYTAPAGTTVTAIATDGAGNTYVTGTTSSTTFPATVGALQTQFHGGVCNTFFTPGGPIFYPCTDAFVIKLDPGGKVLFATYLGGDGGQTAASAICVDASGSVYVGGTTSPITTDGEPNGAPDGFPATTGAAFTNPDTAGAFVAKLSPDGSQVVYATFLPIFPEYPNNYGLAMAIDSGGNAYIASTTQIALINQFAPTPGAFQVATQNKSVAGIVTKLNPSGSALVYATYLSGGLWDVPQGIAVDASGNAYITGYTSSQNFPVTPGALQTAFPGSGGGYSGFVTKLNPQGTGLVYSTFLGEINNGDGTWQIKADPQGGAYVLSTGALALSYGGYLSHLSPDGSSLISSNFLPTATGLDVDSTGDVFVAGVIADAGLSSPSWTFQPAFGGGASDAYIVKFAPDGYVDWTTYLGGTGADSATLLAVAPNGSVAVAGTTVSSDFPGISVPASIAAPATFVTSLFGSLTVINAAGYVAGAVAPGEIVELRGYGIGPEAGVAASGGTSLPPQLGGVQVYFGNLAAPIFYAQAQQVNVQVPWQIPTRGSVAVSIQVAAGGGSYEMATVAPAAPGIFSVNNSDGTPNSPANPAKAGDMISIYGTGGGVTNPIGVNGGFWPATTPFPALTLPVSVTVGGISAQVLYQGSAPTLETGYFQINALLPVSLPKSAQSYIYVTIGGVSSPSAAMQVAIQ